MAFGSGTLKHRMRSLTDSVHHLQPRHLASTRSLLFKMAAASRTALLRQTQLLSSKRLFANPTQPLRLLRTAPSISSRRILAPQWSVTSRITSFSTTSARKILPPGPQVIQGGVNDPAPVPKPDPLHGSYHWTFERLLSVGLVPLTIVPFAAGSLSPALDAAFIFTILVHSHIGFQ